MDLASQRTEPALALQGGQDPAATWMYWNVSATMEAANKLVPSCQGHSNVLALMDMS